MTATQARPRRILLTGASGKLGNVVREGLRELCDTLRLSDIVAPPTELATNEEFVQCDLADHAGMGELLRDVDLVVHFGGNPHERPFEELLQPNLVGPFNLYDNALKHGVRRIVLASSSHIAGLYGVDESPGRDSPFRPDSLYGVTKAYGETLARFYHDRHGLETVCLRIGSCFPKPKSVRCLRAWLSQADLIRLVQRAVLAERVGFAVVWGVSNNPQNSWGDDDAARIGYRPQDCAEDYRAELLALGAEAFADPRLRLQGGNMVSRDYRYEESLFPNPPPPLRKDQAA